MWRQDLNEKKVVVPEHAEYTPTCRAGRTTQHDQTWFDMSARKQGVQCFQSTCATLPAAIHKDITELSNRQSEQKLLNNQNDTNHFLVLMCTTAKRNCSITCKTCRPIVWNWVCICRVTVPSNFAPTDFSS